MGNEIPLQLAQFLRSILLGGTLALLYDITRALRRLGGRIWETALDALISISSVFALFLLVMAEEGELRLFILMGTAGGAVLFFVLLSPVFRPVLAFWVNLMMLPLHLGHKFLRKMQKNLKKVFSFLKKWFTIIVTQMGKSPWRERQHGAQSRKTENPPQQ